VQGGAGLHGVPGEHELLRPPDDPAGGRGVRPPGRTQPRPQAHATGSQGRGPLFFLLDERTAVFFIFWVCKLGTI